MGSILRAANWPGVTDAEALKDAVVTASHRLADVAKAGDWNAVLALLGASHWLGPNHRHLDALVRERTSSLDPVAHRTVATEVIALEALDSLWFAYPGMYGGFSLTVHLGRLHVESWCRVVAGWRQAHVITADRCVLVDDGWI